VIYLMAVFYATRSAFSGLVKTQGRFAYFISCVFVGGMLTIILSLLCFIPFAWLADKMGYNASYHFLYAARVGCAFNFILVLVHTIGYSKEKA